MQDASATQLLGAGVGNTLVVPNTSTPLPLASASDSSSEIEYGPGGFGKNTSALTSASNCKLFVFTKLAKFNVSDEFVEVPMGPHVTLTALRNSKFGVFGWLKLMSLSDTVSVCTPDAVLTARKVSWSMNDRSGEPGELLVATMPSVTPGAIVLPM